MSTRASPPRHTSLGTLADGNGNQPIPAPRVPPHPVPPAGSPRLPQIKSDRFLTKSNMKADRARRVENNLAIQQEVFERAYSTLVNGLKHVDRKFIESLRSVEAEKDAKR